MTDPALRSAYDPGAAWPCMRADRRNSGVSPLLGTAIGPPPPGLGLRRWSTGNGVFSTPVIGADETVYVGSADKSFYALDPVSGRERWRFATGECIDCAGAIATDGTVYFASCDAGLYGLTPQGEERWRLNLFADRRHFTPSSIYWWEGNVVLGPNGLLYAGNDDFNAYAIEPGGEVRWAYLTGLHIWAAPSFSADGAVYFASFDRHLYALDAETGARRWSTNTGNFVVSSPAIGGDGTIFFGSFDSHVYAVEPRSGTILWKLPTGGPIYASPALAPDGRIYIGSSDGNLYAIEPDGPAVAWTFYTGDAIRGSASIGPDPEGRCPYLVYFASGNGLVYALEPGGRRRWSLDTHPEGNPLDSPNINSSIALGRWGLAAAAASGNVFYIPYDHYLTAADDSALDRRPHDGYPDNGTFLYPMTVGGRIAAEPLGPATRAALVEPNQPLSFRVIARRGGRSVPVRVAVEDCVASFEPRRPCRVTLQPDASQINVLPEGDVPAMTEGRVHVRARFVAAADAGTIEGALPFAMLPDTEAPPIDRLAELPFRITHMSIYDPPIVPSFDQIGIASLTIQARVASIDAASGKVVAWGLKKFGMEEGAVQVALPRHLFYAFAGTYRDGRLVLTARHCRFELTAFPVPLDSFRLSGTWEGSNGPRVGAALVAELDVTARFRPFGGGDGPVATGASSWGAAWAQVSALLAKWVPDAGTALRSLPQLLRLAGRMLPLGVQVLRREMYGPWGLIGEDGWFRGVGSFRAKADEALAPERFTVRTFRHQGAGNRLVAEVAARDGEPLAHRVPGILLIDARTHEPVRLDYDAATRIRRDAASVTVELALPRGGVPAPGGWLAVLLLDVTPLADLRL